MCCGEALSAAAFVQSGNARGWHRAHVHPVGASRQEDVGLCAAVHPVAAVNPQLVTRAGRGEGGRVL